MKKVIAIIVLFFVGAMVVNCSRPTITKEQQDNVVTRIARWYEVSEVEFLRFTKNWSTGSYILKLKINGDDSKEVTALIEDKKELDSVDLDFMLSPVGDFDDIERTEKITGDISISNIKIFRGLENEKSNRNNHFIFCWSNGSHLLKTNHHEGTTRQYRCSNL